MTAPHSLNPARLLDQALSDASPDLMRHLLTTVINALLSAEADAVCGAEYGQSSPDRVTQRNGYRRRELVPPYVRGLQYLDPPAMIQTGRVPLHPSAVRAYRDLHG